MRNSCRISMKVFLRTTRYVLPYVAIFVDSFIVMMVLQSDELSAVDFLTSSLMLGILGFLYFSFAGYEFTSALGRVGGEEGVSWGCSLFIIHRYLFGDLYTFAGHYRKEDIRKGQTRFLNHTQIADKLSSLLSKLKEEQYLAGLDFEAFAERSAFYFAELNYIHPFREGNGRSCREFMRMLYEHNGYEVVWDTVPREKLLQIMEESVYDSTSLANLTKEYLKQT